MKRLILYFILLLGSIWLGVKIYQQPGYVLILYQQWAIETTGWFLVLLLMLLVLVGHLLLNLLKGVIHLPTRLNEWWDHRKLHNSLKSLNLGFNDLVKGEYKKAEKALLKSSHNKTLAGMSYMMAAQASNQQKNFAKRDHYLSKAKNIMRKKDYSVEILEAEFFLKSHQPENALSLLAPLRAQHPKDKQLLKLHAESLNQLGDWGALQGLLKELRKAKIPNEIYLPLEKDTYLNLLKNHFYKEFSEVQNFWNQMPKYLRHDPDILVAYAGQLKRWNRQKEAEELIKKELNQNYHPALMTYYVSIPSAEPVKQLALGQKYLKQHLSDSESLQAMGMLCLRNRLWGQARDYLLSSVKINPSSQTFSALGYVYEKLGENEKALRYYRKGLSYLISL